MTLGCGGHGVSTTARTSRPAARAASTVSSEWLMVPRPGPRGHHHRPAEVDREVADRVAERERHEQPAHALADHHVAAQAARGGHQSGGVEDRAGELGGEVRRHRRAEAMRRDLVGGASRGGGQQLVIGGTVRTRPPRRGR